LRFRPDGCCLNEHFLAILTVKYSDQKANAKRQKAKKFEKDCKMEKRIFKKLKITWEVATFNSRMPADRALEAAVSDLAT